MEPLRDEDGKHVDGATEADHCGGVLSEASAVVAIAREQKDGGGDDEGQ